MKANGWFHASVFFNLRRPLERRLDDSQNRSPRFGEEQEIGNVTLSRSHLAHSVVTIRNELYHFLALAEPALTTPPFPSNENPEILIQAGFLMALEMPVE